MMLFFEPTMVCGLMCQNWSPGSNFAHWLLHMLYRWSRIVLYLICSSPLSLFRWTLNCLDITITSWCYFLMAGIDLISPLGQRIWNVVTSRSNLTNWNSMNRLFHGVVKCINESFIAAWYGITNRLVYGFRKEMPVFSFDRICLPM